MLPKDPLVAEHLLAAYARTHADEIRSLYRARPFNNHMGTFGVSHTDPQDHGTGIVIIPSPYASNRFYIGVTSVSVGSNVVPRNSIIEDVD